VSDAWGEANAAELGLIPWSADEFLAIHNEAVDERSSSPDLRVTLIRDGEEEDLAEAPTELIAVRILRSRYPREVADAHWRRYRLLHAFLTEHHEELRADGWIGEDGINYALLTALATAPFAGAEFDVEAGSTRLTFSLEDIKRRAVGLVGPGGTRGQ
jgi:hypothetical protein